jgi:hypothetical protein
VSANVGGANVAVTLLAAFIVTVHVVVAPEQPPLQPTNVLPPFGAAVNVTTVPAAKLPLHVPGQTMPAGLDATPPVPAPAVATVSVYVDAIALKLAVTVFAASIVTVHVGAVPLHAPLQPPKALVALGVAASVTVEPVGAFVVQTPGHAMPLGLDVTEPPPVPVVLTVSACVEASNRADTVLATVSGTVQLVLAPAHAPPQPTNVAFDAGTAVSTTLVPNR